MKNVFNWFSFAARQFSSLEKQQKNKKGKTIARKQKMLMSDISEELFQMEKRCENVRKNISFYVNGRFFLFLISPLTQ